jgi:ATP-dependent DNA ligase
VSLMPALPMKLTDVGSDAATVQSFIDDPDWVMQQKLDGARMLMVFENDEIIFTNNGTGPIKFAAVVQKLPPLEKQLLADFHASFVNQLILDGEFIVETGVYHVWDVLVFREFEYANMPEGYNLNRVDGTEDWDVRDKVLRNELSFIQSPIVQFSRTARTREEKSDLWAGIQSTNVEGAVSKLISSSYDEGERTVNWVKHKLVKTADAVVTKVERTFKPDGVTVSHGSATLAVTIDPRDDPAPWVNAKGKRISAVEFENLTFKGQMNFTSDRRSLYPVGNASLIGRELTIDVGSVVEVNYLYFDRAMIQPRIVRQRWDKTPAECRMDQFPAYTREIV